MLNNRKTTTCILSIKREELVLIKLILSLILSKNGLFRNQTVSQKQEIELHWLKNILLIFILQSAVSWSKFNIFIQKYFKNKFNLRFNLYKKTIKFQVLKLVKKSYLNKK